MLRRISILFILATGTVLGQQSLQDYLSLAMQNSTVLKTVRDQQILNRIQGQIDRAENAAFKVSLTADYLFTPYFNNHGDWVSTNPSEQAIGYDINLFDGGLYSTQVNLERNLFNGRLIHTLDRQTEIQDADVRYTWGLESHNLQFQVTDQYVNTYRSLLLSRLAQEMVTHLEDQLRLTGELVQQGFAQAQDYLLLKIELKNQSIGLSDARQDYRSALCQLDALCGIAPSETAVEIDSVALIPTHPNFETQFVQRYTLDSLLTNNQQALFETQYLPQVGAFFNAGLNAVTLKNIQRKWGMSAGLSLSVPLYDGRQKRLHREQSQVTQGTILANRRFSEKNIALQRRDLAAKIQTLKQNIHALEEQVSDYREVLDLSQAALRQGHVSMIDHLTLLRNFVDLRKQKIETEIQYQLEINRYNYWNW